MKVAIEGEWDAPEPDWTEVISTLAELGIYDVDIKLEEG